MRKSRMNLKARFASVLLAVIFLGAGHAPAMDFLFFARMALDDQTDYVTSLVMGSAKMLRTTGHADQAQKAIALFKNPTNSGGIHQLAQVIKGQAQQNIRNADNPNLRVQPFDVESAMQMTLRNNGVDVPLKFLETINKNFAPQLPLRAQPISG